MLVDYFIGYVRARNLDTAAQIKITGETIVGIYRSVDVSSAIPSGKYKIVSWKKKNLKTSKICLFSFRLYFVNAKVVLCISIMYYLSV